MERGRYMSSFCVGAEHTEFHGACTMTSPINTFLVMIQVIFTLASARP